MGCLGLLQLQFSGSTKIYLTKNKLDEQLYYYLLSFIEILGNFKTEPRVFDGNIAWYHFVFRVSNVVFKELGTFFKVRPSSLQVYPENNMLQIIVLLESRLIFTVYRRPARRWAPASLDSPIFPLPCWCYCTPPRRWPTANGDSASSGGEWCRPARRRRALSVAFRDPSGPPKSAQTSTRTPRIERRRSNNVRKGR